MINIIRESTPPLSLQNEKIKKYLEECSLYKNDPENNDKPKPPVSYRNSDLLEAFDRCFHSKCYLTEAKFFNSWAMDVEHFIPQNENSSLVYEWNNLYPAEHKANMQKPRQTPKGGYLDPCSIDDNVEEELFYTLTALGETPSFEAKDPTNIKAKNTASLLNKLHNGTNANSIHNTADLRHQISKKYRAILEKICEWYQSPPNSQEKVRLKNELRAFLSRKSAFTMLCRSIPAVRRLPADFFD